MKVILTSLLFLSLMGGMVQVLWEKSFLMKELSQLVSRQKEQRESLWRAIDLAGYTSLGLRRKMKRQDSPFFGSEVIPKEDQVMRPVIEKDSDETSLLMKKYKAFPRSEAARIDLCSTLLEEHPFFVDRLEKLLTILYSDDSHFIHLKKTRPNLEKDLLKEVRESLKEVLAWNNPERLPQIECLQPDTSWLLSLRLPSHDLHQFFHRILRLQSTPDQEPKSLLFYVCVFRWHPYAIKMPRIHIASASVIMLNLLLGEDLASLVKEKFSQTLNKAGFESIEEDHYTGLWKLLKPLVIENIFLESCSELGIDQNQFDNVLDFSRYTPPRQEWLLDLVTDSGLQMGWRMMKRPFF